LSKEWKVKGEENPVTLALGAYQYLVKGTVSLLCFFGFLVFMITQYTWSAYWFVGALGAVGFFSTFIVMLLKGAGAKFVSAEQFCEAITLIEELAGPLDDVNNKNWHVEGEDLGNLKKMAHKVLTTKATDVRRLQAIPWRKNEALDARVVFEGNMQQLHRLLGVSFDYKRYFGEGLVDVPEFCQK
jgi:hypothetical protein